MKYTVYSPINGQIISTIYSSKVANLELNLPEGSSWIEGEYSGDAYYIKEGAAVELPAKPDYPADFDYSLEQWVWDEDQSWDDLRSERDKLLAASDWTQVPDAPVDQPAWATYRQELRELPDNTEDPRNITWPTKP
tara:strand:- start:204 stop:611 length:408 start_codon:yes stop_codon:yes gene_type:complete